MPFHLLTLDPSANIFFQLQNSAILANVSRQRIRLFILFLGQSMPGIFIYMAVSMLLERLEENLTLARKDSIFRNTNTIQQRSKLDNG